MAEAGVHRRGVHRRSIAASVAVRLWLCPLHARTGVSARGDTSLTRRPTLPVSEVRFHEIAAGHPDDTALPLTLFRCTGCNRFFDMAELAHPLQSLPLSFAVGSMHGPMRRPRGEPATGPVRSRCYYLPLPLPIPASDARSNFHPAPSFEGTGSDPITPAGAFRCPRR